MTALCVSGLLVAAGVAPGVTGGSGRAVAAPPTAVTEVLATHTVSGDPIPCAARPDGIRVCHGDMGGSGDPDLRLASFDGTPLEVFVTLPPAPGSGSDGDYPLIVQSHGWGMPPTGPDDPQYGGLTAAELARNGYAVLQFSARGWGHSCGTVRSRQVSPAACAEGYLRLDDYRYEIRDVQNGIGLLVDEGLADPDRLGVTGESYGAGASLGVATLNDRIMNPDGSLSPWTSPGGTPLRIAGAAPLSGWSDLVYALMPNGRTFTDQVTSTTADLSPVGVWKQSIGTLLYSAGSLIGYYAPEGTNPEADITGWFATMEDGEPYDGPEHAYITDQMARYHSPYYLLAGAYGVDQAAPAPLMLTSGFTDAIFPADEYLRYYNLAGSLYPDNPISLFFYDGGHQRGQNKADDKALLVERLEAFFDHYVKGTGTEPDTGVTVLSQTCDADAPSGGPFQADTWEELQQGTVTHHAAAAQRVDSSAGDQDIAETFEPLLGGLACTTARADDQGDGVGTWRLPAATGAGYTLLGAPTVTADLQVTGDDAYLAARLFDVDPATGTETLISRGVYRFDPDAPDGRQRFPLTPNAWHFAAGHIPKLELLGQDSPYLRRSNGTFSVTVTNLELTLPTHEATDQPEPPGGDPAEPDRTVPAPPPADGSNHPRPIGTDQPGAPREATPARPVRATPTFTG